MRLNSVFWISLGVLCVLCGDSSSAPPSLTSLFPAGGQVGSSAEITASGSFDKWPVGVWASDPKISVKPAKDKGKLAIAIAVDAKPGVAWLRLHDATGASPLRPFVVGVLPETMEVEPNDEVSKPQAIAHSCVVNGKLAKGGDVDLFAVTLRKGQTLVASLEANRTLRSPMDAVLQIVSVDGFVLDQDHDFHGLDPQLAFVAPKDGTYIARIFAFPSQPDSTIRHFGSELCVYRLTLATAGFVDFPVPLATKIGSNAKVQPSGWNLSISPVVPGSIEVRNEVHDCFDFTSAKAEAALVPPFTLTGCVRERQATNSFPVKVTKGKSVTFQIESRSLELPLTPVLRVVDGEGKQLARAEPAKPNVDCELTFVPTKDETVRVEVRDLYRDGGPRFAYRLRAVYPEPDFEATVANDRFALAAGTPLEVPITTVMKGGLLALLTSDFELKAEGLPPEVKVELVAADPKLPAKDRQPKVKFTANGNTSSAFRLNLVASMKNGAKLVRPVRTALADFETTTADLWLTAGVDAKVTAPMPKKKK